MILTHFLTQIKFIQKIYGSAFKDITVLTNSLTIIRNTLYPSKRKRNSNDTVY